MHHEFSIVPRLGPPVPAEELRLLTPRPLPHWRDRNLAAPRDQCDRCGGREFHSVTIHNGASVRRDCARCGRFCGWERWRADADAPGGR